MRLFISGILLLAVAGIGIFLWPSEKKDTSIEVTLDTVEIADTPEERAQGLSGRTSIPDDHGMLFVFPEAGSYGFWMKDMQTSIDIIWLSDDGEVLRVNANVSPDTYPDSFYPPRPVRYVLETRAGLAGERGWGLGTVLELPFP